MRARGAGAGLVAATAVLLTARAGSAQTTCPETGTDLGLAPAYLDDTEGDRSMGVELSFASCRPEYDTRPRFPRARYLGVQARGTVPLTELAIPQNLAASAWYGVSLSLSERAPDDPDAPLDEAPDAFAFHHGFLGLGARIQYESSGDFDEQALAGGLELRYADPRRSLLPSTVVVWDWVKPTTSEVRDLLDLEGDVHGRLGVRGYWLVPIAGRFEAEVDGAYFWTFGLHEALEARGWDEGPYLAGTLAYGLGRPLGPLMLRSLFVGYAYGQRPTAGREDRAWTLGAEIGVR